MTDPQTRPYRAVTSLIATGLFCTGITYASTLNFGAIVGIDTLGIPNALYSLQLMIASLVSAAASVLLGYVSDKVADRRILVVGAAAMGALGFGLIFAFRTPLVFILAICAIMPFGGALYSQSFSFARSYYNVRHPARAEFMISILRTIFSVAWVIVPPVVGWVAATTTVFNAYGIAAVAFLACAGVYLLLLRYPEAKIGVARTRSGQPAPALAKARIEPAVLGGICGVTLIFVAIQIRTVTVPLLITTTLKGSFTDLGVFAGLAAAIEIPFMILWGYALRWVSKHAIIICGALLYAAYLLLLSRAGTIAEVLWLQLLNGPATAALLAIPISYLQDAIKGRVGLSTSLLDVVNVVASLSSATFFGLLTASAQNYPALMVVAAGLSGVGALILFAAHRTMGRPPAPATSR